jgi:hypothetical protein
MTAEELSPVSELLLALRPIPEDEGSDISPDWTWELQRVTTSYNELQRVTTSYNELQRVTTSYNELQRVTTSYNELQRIE